MRKDGLDMEQGASKLEAILEALPYFSRYRGKTVVIKVGGSMEEGETVLEDVQHLNELGIRTVLVHGGGRAISLWLERTGKETRFINGLRCTDAETLEMVQMVLVGKVNSELVARLQGAGGRAFGLAGLDGGLLRAEIRDQRLGFVGEIVSVDLAPLRAVLEPGYIPVVAPVALAEGGQLLNVNADTVAGELAFAMAAEKLVFLTDVPGVQGRDGRLISRLTAEECRHLIHQGIIQGGMIPKVQACIRATASVPRTHIVDGRVPHALLTELFTESGVGTMIVAS